MSRGIPVAKIVDRILTNARVVRWPRVDVRWRPAVRPKSPGERTASWSSAPTRATSSGGPVARSPPPPCAVSARSSSACRTASAASRPVSGCEGKSLDEIKAIRRDEAEAAASALGAEIEFLDLGDYPLVESPEAVAKLVDVYRRVQPTVVLTHPLADPYNGDHPAAARMALQARVLAQAIGVANSDGSFPGRGRDHRRTAGVLLRAAPARAVRLQAERAARHHGGLPAEARRDGVPARAEAHVVVLHRPRRSAAVCRSSATPARTSGLPHETMGEAYMRYFPQVTDVLGMTGHVDRHRHRASRCGDASTRSASHGVATVHEAHGPDRARRAPASVRSRMARASRASAVTVLCRAGRQPHDPRRDRAVPRRATCSSSRRRRHSRDGCVRRALRDGAAGARRARPRHHDRGARCRRPACDGLPGVVERRQRAGHGEGDAGLGQRPDRRRRASRSRPGDVIVADDDGVAVVPRETRRRGASPPPTPASRRRRPIARAYRRRRDLSLDRNGLRQVLADLGVDVRDAGGVRRWRALTST